MSDFSIYDSSGLKSLLARSIIGTTLTTSEDNSLARWDTSVNYAIQDSQAFADDNDNITIPTGSSITFAGSGSVIFTEAGGTDTIELRGPNSTNLTYSLILPATGGVVGQGLYIESISSDEYQLGWQSTGTNPGGNAGADNEIVLWNDTTGDSFTGSDYRILDNGNLVAPTGSDITLGGSGTVIFTEPGASTTISLGLNAGGIGTGFYILPNQYGNGGDFLSVIDIEVANGNAELAWWPGLRGETGASVSSDPQQIFVTDGQMNVFGATGQTAGLGAGDVDNIMCGVNPGAVSTSATGNMIIGFNNGVNTTTLVGSTLIGSNNMNGVITQRTLDTLIGNDIIPSTTDLDNLSGSVIIGNSIGVNNTANAFVNANSMIGNRIFTGGGSEWGYATAIGNDLVRGPINGVVIGRKIAISQAVSTDDQLQTVIGFEAAKNAEMMSSNWVRNTVIGTQALSATTGVTSALRSVYLGTRSGFNNNTGLYTVAIGYEAMGNKIAEDKYGSIAIGRRALYDATGIPTGANTVIGRFAAQNLENSGFNVLIGDSVMTSAVQGYTGNSENVVIGNNAFASANGGSPTEGTWIRNTGNTIIGCGAAPAATTGSYNVVIGNNAGYVFNAGTGCVFIGAGTNQASLSNTVAIGVDATGTSAAGACFLRHRSFAAVGNNALWDGDELVEDTSSIRFKMDIRRYMDEKDSKFDSIRPVWYKSKPGCGPNVDEDIPGLIAEELAKLYPEYVVFEDKKNTIAKGIDYSRLSVLLIDKIQKMNANAKTQEKKLQKLERLVNHLEKMV